MILFLQILGGLAAVALGFYLGSGRYSQTQEEIEARLGGGKPRRSKRHFMWLNYLKADERASERGRARPRFKMAVARDRTAVARGEDDRGTSGSHAKKAVEGVQRVARPRRG